jgi:signal transduction histidine kinase
MFRKYLSLLIFGSLTLSALLLAIGLNTSRRLDATVTSLFNRQQLLVARSIAHEIEMHVDVLESQLTTLHDLAPSRLSQETQTRDLVRYREWDVIAVGRQSSHGLLLHDLVQEDLRDPGTWRLPDSTAASARATAPDPYVGPDFLPQSGPFAGRWIMFLVLAGESGLDFFVIDPLAMARRHTQGVRSWKVGYPWVVNRQGVFLVHPHDGFLGRSNLNARLLHNPGVDYSRIDDLVAGRMTVGDEGTGTYVSGWDREDGKAVDKLVAYSPARYAGPHSRHLWSVAVSAPAGEVYGVLEPLLFRQWLQVAGVVALILAGFAVAVWFALRWGKVLSRKVEERTRELRESEAKLRVERDKVKEGMQNLMDAQEKLLRHERFAAIGQAASHLAHEIKNPLLLMGGFASQVRKKLKAGEGNPDEMAKNLQIVEREAKRLESMLREVHGFTKPARLNPVPVSLPEIVNETLEVIVPDNEEQGIETVVEIEPGLPHLCADADKLKQVFLNLVKNAVEAMETGGRLTVSAWAENGEVRAKVADTGPGMDPETQENVFSPFYTTKDKGTGLGLAVSYRIISDHHGEIVLDSAPGRGTAFTLTFTRLVPAGSDECSLEEEPG